MANIFQERITPEKPKVLGQERIFVYVPKASTTQAGIASFKPEDFTVDTKGKVSIIWPYAYQYIPGIVNVQRNSAGYLKFTNDSNHYLQVDSSKISGDITTAIETHNSSAQAHPIIRNRINILETKIGDLDDLHEEIEDRDNLVDAINYVYENAGGGDVDEKIAEHNNAQNAHNNRITNLESGKVDKTNITSGHIGAIGYGTDGSVALGENDLTNQSYVHITPTKVELSAGLIDSDAKKVELTKDNFRVDNKEVLLEGDIKSDGTTITENDDSELQAIAITDGTKVIDVDEIENIRNQAEGKTASYVAETLDDITGVKDDEDNFTNVTAIDAEPECVIANLKLGDIILIVDTEVKDYWVSKLNKTGDVVTSVSLNKLETSKIDLTNYYTKDEADDLLDGVVHKTDNETIAGLKTFTNGLQVKTRDDYKWQFYNDAGGASLGVGYSNTQNILQKKFQYTNTGAFRPENNNDQDLGILSAKWKDLYLSGNITDGTNEISVANIASKQLVESIQVEQQIIR